MHRACAGRAQGANKANARHAQGMHAVWIPFALQGAHMPILARPVQAFLRTLHKAALSHTCNTPHPPPIAPGPCRLGCRSRRKPSGDSDVQVGKGHVAVVAGQFRGTHARA